MSSDAVIMLVEDNQNEIDLMLRAFSKSKITSEVVVARDPKYDFHRAIGLLAHAYANTGQAAKAETLFKQATDASTLSETYLNYANFLAAQCRTAEARDWAQRVLARKPTMPRYLQRRERPWFRKASGILKSLPKA